MQTHASLGFVFSITTSIGLALATSACVGDNGAPLPGSGAGGDPSAGASTGSSSSSSSTSGAGGAGTTSSSSGSGGAASASGWLYTKGNHIYTPDGAVWHGRGANIQDTRGCSACAYDPPDVGEVNRRIDELVDVWGANFIRLTLESYAQPAPYMVQWQNAASDPGYLTDVASIVHHAVEKPGVYVLVSLWIDPTISGAGWPTQATDEEWKVLAQTFKDDAHVLFGVVNEPEYNFDGADDPNAWTAMNNAVAAIREAEDAAGAPHHIVAVQGTGGWARRLDYYTTHPITAGGGDNIAYETHVYNPASDFGALFQEPSKTLPVIIGEFGPADGYMNEQDCADLMVSAEALEIPYLAWTFHMRCAPNLLVDNSQGTCGGGMALQPTTWGTLLKDRLAMPW